ncbi:MAG: hypothetical protein VW270_10220 [Candidatus Poseidoniales archaeon]|jgi:septum formation topological specificity factor MinE
MLLDALRKHAEGHIAKHKANVLVYLNNPVGVGEHPDIIETMEKEILEIAKYQDVIDMLDNHFSEEEQKQYTLFS